MSLNASCNVSSYILPVDVFLKIENFKDGSFSVLNKTKNFFYLVLDKIKKAASLAFFYLMSAFHFIKNRLQNYFKGDIKKDSQTIAPPTKPGQQTQSSRSGDGPQTIAPTTKPDQQPQSSRSADDSQTIAPTAKPDQQLESSSSEDDRQTIAPTAKPDQQLESSSSVNDPQTIAPTTNPDHRIQKKEVAPEVIDAAREILNCSWEVSGIPDSEQIAEDAHKKCPLGLTISQGQGSLKFRKQVVQSTEKFLQAISPAALRAASDEQNDTVYQILKYKRLAQTLAFKETLNEKITIPTKDGKGWMQVHLESFNDALTMPMLKASLYDFFDSEPELTDKKEVFLKVFSHSLNNDNLTDEKINQTFEAFHNKEKSLPLLIGTGWDWHSTQLIIFRDPISDELNYFYCNRGRDSEKYGSGWRLYRGGNKDKITKDWVRKAAARISSDHSNYLSEDKIMYELNSQLIYSHTEKTQKTGNCTVNSLKSAISALFALDQLTDGFKNKIKDNEKGELSNFNWLKTYKKFSMFDRRLLLEDFLIDLERVSQSDKEDDNVVVMASLLHSKLIRYMPFKSIGERIGWDLWLKIVKKCEEVNPIIRPVPGVMLKKAEEYLKKQNGSPNVSMPDF